jgi:hypothetical protein
MSFLTASQPVLGHHDALRSGQAASGKPQPFRFKPISGIDVDLNKGRSMAMAEDI